MELPVLDQEIFVIINYIKNAIDSDIKKELINNITLFENHQHRCPFLVNNICGIYEVRPIVCRIFYMKNKKCVPGENWKNRSDDVVMCYNQSELLDAIICLHKFYGINDGRYGEIYSKIYGIDKKNLSDRSLFRKLLEQGFFFEKMPRSLFSYPIKEIYKNNSHFA